MRQEKATVIEHHNFQGEYRILRLSAPRVGPLVKPGQFIHLLILQLGDRILRRPFSIYRADDTGVTILYKPVGRGTEAMKALQPNDQVDIIGPLGNGYPESQPGRFPVLVAGGYGNAALYLKAKALPVKGVAFFGGRTAQDILCVDEFLELGWDVRTSTEDGSLGTKGLITAAIDPWLKEQEAAELEFFVCGPNPMLKAIGERAVAQGFTAWLSMDENMVCGVGACLTCVIKRKTADGGWEWARCCKDGPVFEAGEVLWDD